MKSSSLQETIRSDGLRIITKRIFATKRVCLALIANVGSAYDNVPGTHHFREHLAFSGTTTRSATEIKNLIGRYFLYSNAITEKLNTIFLGEAVYLRFRELTDVLFDIYINPVFPEESIKKERDIILNEIIIRRQDDVQTAYEKLFRLLWKHNPIRHNGLGTSKSIVKITRNHLLAAHRKWYVPCNTVVVGTGRINHEELVAAAYRAFPITHKQVSYRHWDHEADILPTRREATIWYKGREHAIVMAGVKISPFGEETRDQLLLLNAIVGQGWDSLLWQEIREKRGLAYDVTSGFMTPHSQLGYCMFFMTEVMPNDIEETKTLIRDLVCVTPLDRNHFQRQKEAFLDSWLVANEYASDWEDIIIQRIVQEGKPISHFNNYTEKRIRQLSRVSFDQICALRESLLTPERLACVVVRPV